MMTKILLYVSSLIRTARVHVQVSYNSYSQKDADAETSFGETSATSKPARAGLFNKPKVNMSPEEQARADDIDMRCLSLCIGMLERVNGVGVVLHFLEILLICAVFQTFEENSTLDGILSEVIVPAVKRKEIAFREKGLVGLGLCCLIARVCIVFYRNGD
jgi:Chromosome condensation complex Condensin, subunit G